jgi:hypothetical protein
MNYCQLQHFQLNQNFAVFPANVLHFVSYPAATVILHSTICCLISGILLAYKLDFMLNTIVEHLTGFSQVAMLAMLWVHLFLTILLGTSCSSNHNLCKSGNAPPCSIHICILAARSTSPKYGGRSFSSKFLSQAAVKLFSTK